MCSEMKKQKKLMLLGGLRYLLPVIDAAHKQGYYVITADYLPDNIAHKYSDEYCNGQEPLLRPSRRRSDKDVHGVEMSVINDECTVEADRSPLPRNV